MTDVRQLERLSAEIRHLLVRMSHQAETAHLGGALSCVDLLVALYGKILRVDPGQPHDPARDRLVFSKGHAVSALYATLAVHSFFPVSKLESYNQPGSGLPEQPAPGCTPGIEWATGSLGHGLGVGLGMALASAINAQKYSTYVILSDGECQEGSVWEAAMLAPRLSCSPLTALVDFNGWQATGRSREIMQMEPLVEKWRSFGWEAFEIDGHEISEVLDVLQRPFAGKPRAIVARTVKGRGVSFIEDDNNWHYRSPSVEEVEKARVELLGSENPS
jgi:transketolase